MPAFTKSDEGFPGEEDLLPIKRRDHDAGPIDQVVERHSYRSRSTGTGQHKRHLDGTERRHLDGVRVDDGLKK